MDICESYLSRRISSFIDYEKQDTIERLIQIIIDITRVSYTKICGDNIDKNKDMIPAKELVLDLNGISISQTTGEIKIKKKLAIKNLLYFTVFWGQLFLVNLVGMVSFKKKNKYSITIAYGLGLKQVVFNGSDSRFIDYCKDGPIKPLNNANKIFVHDYWFKGNLSSTDVFYTKHPIAKLLYESNLSFNQRLYITYVQIIYVINYFIRIIKEPLVILLARDIAVCPTILGLDCYGYIKNILITNSWCIYQPLWMRGPSKRNYCVHEIFYSHNDKLVTFNKDKLTPDDFPMLFKQKVDEYWVWTEGKKNELENNGVKSKIHVVGPILWYLPEKDNTKIPDDEIRIAIFDIMPFDPKIRNSLGVIRNQYTTKNSILFLDDIVSILHKLNEHTNKKIVLYLKHKRPHSDIHDVRYLKYVQELIDKKIIIKLSNDINLYNFLESCDLSINITYTSVAYISSHLKKMAIYYDPAEEIFPIYEKTPYIQFISGKNDLFKVITKLIIKDD